MIIITIPGPVHALLTDANKHQCEFCGGTYFQLGIQMDENTDLESVTKAYDWENSTPTNIQGNMETIPLLCHCGRVSGLLAFCIDVASASSGAGTVTTTAIAAAVANGLAGLYLIPLGGTDAGTAFPIVSNTVADPTVITVTGAPNANTATQLILLTSFKIF